MTIQYDFNKMHQLADDLREELRVLVSQSDTLESEIKSSMDSAWQSDDAKGQYDDVQQRWNTEFADTQDILNRLIQAVDQSANDMRSKDQQIGATFQ